MVVIAVRDYAANVVTYNPTVDGVDPYHVVAGGTPILVHNEGCKLTTGGKRILENAADMAAAGDGDAVTAIKLIKQASGKARKHGGK